MNMHNEPPTPKKIRDAYKKGNVPHSKELISACTFIGISCLIMTLFPWHINIVSTSIIKINGLYSLDIIQASRILFYQIFFNLMVIILPILLLNISISILVSLINVGFVFSTEVVKPSSKRINLIEGFKKIFSKKNLIEFLKSCTKVIILTFLIYHIIIESIPLIINSIHCDLSCMLVIFKKQIWKIIILVNVFFIIIAFLDVIFQHWNYRKQLSMSYDEIKRENKDVEGDPIIKHKRQQLHYEISMQNIVENVKKSSVVVINPTHIAVGLYYQKDSNTLPTIQIKGQNMMAKFILEIAKKNDIPVIQDIYVARTLYECRLFDYIPSDLIVPVAEIIKWANNLKTQNNI